MATFKDYLASLEDTTIVINKDDMGIKALELSNAVTFAIETDADYVAKNIRFEEGLNKFDLYKSGKFLAEIAIQLPGKHNVYNALAVIAALDVSGVKIELLVPYFKDFTGMGRRLQKVLEFDGITVYDDYAHHPTEINATLTALKSANPEKNLVAVFQPHRYTRLKAFWNEFKTSLGAADSVIVTDVYSASEDEIIGVNSFEFVKGLENTVNYKGSMADVAKQLLPRLKQGDIVVGLGAGTITELGKELKHAKEEKTWVVK